MPGTCPMKTKKNLILYILLWPLLAAVLTVALLLVFISVSDFRPKSIEPVKVKGDSFVIPLPADSSLTFYTWNIGYCGLGEQMDFFYEGGRRVRPSREEYQRYRDGVIYQMTTLFNKPDFILLQEVDSLAKRSYRDNQIQRIEAGFPSYSAAFAVNYNVKFVPAPVFRPMGKVIAGQLTLSRFRPVSAERHAYPSCYSWPKNLFMLDRCFILSRYNVSNGRQLVLINLHNSAFNDAADMRIQELGMLKKLMKAEFDKGNYVIAGGDWNQNPLPYDSSAVSKGYDARCIHPGIPEHALPENWQWAYDSFLPTNRDVRTPYRTGVTPVTLIDFFVLSPNIELKGVKTIETGFRFSDHQPVGMAVGLR